MPARAEGESLVYPEMPEIREYSGCCILVACYHTFVIPDESTPDLGELVRSLRPRIRMLFTRYRLSPQDAEDMLTEALVALVWHGPAVENPGAWLMVTLGHRCSAHWRRRPVRERGTAARLGAQSAPVARAPRQRELVIGRLGLDLSAGEIAARLGGIRRARTLTQRTLHVRAQDSDRLGEPTRRARRRQ